MTPERIFKIANAIALPPWILMMVFPHWSYTKLVIDSYTFPILFAVLYTIFIAMSFGKTKGNFGSLEGVGSLFRNKNALLAGWLHYLAFDLLVGMYEWRDALAINLPQYLLIPALFFTLMFGPFGFFLYLGIRLIYL
ncbi:MAG: ABA4-like family protein [Leptospira sp.]|nr:ABA4-like family protein [Leptospira sp.]